MTIRLAKVLIPLPTNTPLRGVALQRLDRMKAKTTRGPAMPMQISIMVKALPARLSKNEALPSVFFSNLNRPSYAKIRFANPESLASAVTSHHIPPIVTDLDQLVKIFEFAAAATCYRQQKRGGPLPLLASAWWRDQDQGFNATT